MKTIAGNYPFGSKLSPVVQVDRSLKRVFVLGVYASAVHAKWIGPDGRQLVQALAVASEPVIFWDGSGADKIIDAIPVPEAAGHLEPADAKFNGPSVRAQHRRKLPRAARDDEEGDLALRPRTSHLPERQPAQGHQACVRPASDRVKAPGG